MPEEYDKYFVEIKQGEPNVYGIADKKKEAIDCPQITEALLNIPDRRMFLKFPLKGNKSCSHRFQDLRGRWRDSNMNVVASGKVRIPKAEFDAIKIKWRVSERRGSRGRGTRTYYYSPKANAIVLHEADTPIFRRKSTVVDFNVK